MDQNSGGTVICMLSENAYKKNFANPKKVPESWSEKIDVKRSPGRPPSLCNWMNLCKCGSRPHEYLSARPSPPVAPLSWRDEFFKNEDFLWVIVCIDMSECFFICQSNCKECEYFACGEPAISLHSYTVPLVQWSTRLLPVMRDPGSNPRGVLIWNRDSPVSVVWLQACNIFRIPNTPPLDASENFCFWGRAEPEFLNILKWQLGYKCECKTSK
jgi:hypothetical protein